MYTILDLDGTISDDTWRRGRIPSNVEDSKGWDNYHQGLIHDRTINLHMVGKRNIIITSRPSKFRPQTIEWLQKHNIEFSILLMRIAGDLRPSWQVKQDAIEHLREIYEIHNKDIDIAYDDDPDVCAMYKRQGIRCEQVCCESEKLEL